MDAHRERFVQLTTQSVRVRVAAAGEVPWTSEDPDLERKCEALPLSPLLLRHAGSLVALAEPQTQDRLWGELERLHAAPSHILRGGTARLRLLRQTSRRSTISSLPASW